VTRLDVHHHPAALQAPRGPRAACVEAWSGGSRRVRP
jgi:hypothetical protein